MPGRISLRWVIAGLALSIVAPLGLLSTLSIQRAWRRQLANVERQNVATARAISVAIDTEVETTTAALDVFGALHALDVPDIGAFDSLARRLIVIQPDWSALLLADPKGHILAVVPDSDLLHAGSFEAGWARAVAKAQKPLVSSLFEMPGVPGHFVMIGVPIIRDGRIALILGARVRSDSLGAILRQQQAPPNGVVALIDADHQIVARTAQEDSYVGTPATQAFIDASARVAEGSWEAVSPEGRRNYAAFSRSARTGLTTALALPREEVDGPIRRILWLLAGAWLAILGIGSGLGLILGQVIVRAMSSASGAAMALAREQPVDPKPSRITEIDGLARGLRQAAATLQARNRERDEAARLKDEFLMTVSHELRTPLTAIVGWARMLSSGQLRDAQRPRALDAIDRNAIALQGLVNDLLDMSRIVSGKLRLDVQRIDLHDVVGAAIDAVRPASDAKHISLVARPDAAAAMVTGDASRLQQVVWNLLSNAVRFTPAGGRIDVEIDRVAEGIDLLVRDTGPGVDADFLPHAFERFRQGAGGTTRAHGGLGLGLAIVRHLVELHGGTVRAENNTPGPGATFRVLLPSRAAQVPGIAQPRVLDASRIDAGQATPDLAGLSVLVADDDVNARELLTVVLENAGAQVRAASSAEDALMVLEGWSPGVLLSDIEMPGADGYTLIRNVDRQSAIRGTKLVAIALTAHARPEDRRKALEAGFQWHLAKPVDPSELISVIATLVSQAVLAEASN